MMVGFDLLFDYSPLQGCIIQQQQQKCHVENRTEKNKKTTNGYV